MKTYSIQNRCSDSSSYTSAFYRNLYSALLCVSRVRTLILRFADDIPLSQLKILERCYFPYLRDIKIQGAITEPLYTLVNNHSQLLRDLSFFVDREATPLPQFTFGPFPGLKNYHGDGRLLRFILPGSKVHRIVVILLPEDDLEANLRPLSKCNRPIDGISLVTRVWSSLYFELIARHAPDIYDITYCCIFSEEEEERDIELITVGFQIPRSWDTD